METPEKPTPKIELLVGTIASGKSTYALRRAREGSIVVNDDSIVTMLHGGDYKLYSKDLKPLYKTVDLVVVTTALAMGLDVIVDRTNMTRASRKKWTGLASSFDVHIFAIQFPFETPEVHALRRMDHDPRGYTYTQWIEVAERHIRQYEPPSLYEGFDNIFQGKFE